MFDEPTEKLAKKRPDIFISRSLRCKEINSHKALRLFMNEGYKSNHQGIVHCFVMEDLNFIRSCI